LAPERYGILNLDGNLFSLGSCPAARDFHDKSTKKKTDFKGNESDKMADEASVLYVH